MSKARIALLTILTFLAGTAAGYILLCLLVFGIWEATGVHDQDGGGAMAVGLVIAPIVGIIVGSAGAIWMAIRLLRKRAQAPLPAPVAEAKDARFVFRLFCALGGLWLGWRMAGYAPYVLGSWSHDYVVAAIALAGTRYVLPLACAAIGWWWSGRYFSAPD